MATSEENKGAGQAHDADGTRAFEESGGQATAESTGTEDTGSAARSDDSMNMEFVLDIPLEVTVELGRTKMLINDLLKLGQGSVIELTKIAGESLEILANQKPIARGEVVVVNEKYGVRLTEVISPMERIERLR
jgi:flagellar motor switch protein FliN/FliY